MKLISFFKILLIVALSQGCAPGESEDLPSTGNAIPHETAALEQQASQRSRCHSSRWLSRPDGKVEAKTLGEWITLCVEDKPLKSDS
jgi:hypothetical protein